MAEIDTTPVQFLTPVCSLCGKDGSVVITADQEDRFLNRGMTLLQVALPDVDADIREQMKSGIHSDCWDKVFGGEDEG